MSGHQATTPIPGPAGLRENARLLRALTADPAPVLDECSARFGRTFSLGLGPVRMVIVGEPADLSDLFAEPNEAYRWGHIANVLGFIVGPTSIIVSDGEDHRRRRAAVQPALARRRLDGWIPMIVAETDRMIAQRLRPAVASGGDPGVDLYPLGKDLILSITVQAFFGNGLEHRTDEIGAIFDELQDYIEAPAAKQLPHPIPGTRRARVRAARQRFDRLVDEELARRRARPSTGDLLDAFVAAGDTMSTEEIRDQVKTLIGAGYHTTSATLAWTVQRALATPGVWARIGAEADAVLGAADGSIGPDELKALTYTQAVLHESLRIHPAGLFAPRQAVRDVRIGDHVIPKRAMVLWSPYIAGRDGEVWDDPLTFDPERHLDPSPELAARMDAAWVPFGRGPRRCIGFALAQMELTLILARLAQQVDLELVDDRTPRPHGMVVNRPEGGVAVRAPSVSAAASPP